MYDALDIAKYVIDKCTCDGVPISNLQLQKILYFIQLNFFRIRKKAAFTNSIEAWQHGPVVPDVYHSFNEYGGTKIFRNFPKARSIFNSNQEKEIVDRVVTVSRSINVWDLVEKSHRKGSPWDQIYNGYSKDVIPMELIREYSNGR